ncbi:Heat shock protein DnaJ, cysteine-rich domain containing protein [Quillaja saponaria]|uniref:Heat shock protein DnaJ, cysteine-rich domain containing protein n=1 Tax=Quillaja saponaria TaxID=32244 RepID=A0AAD7LGK3_QUISA|nr:Heat shock protein DnaJ, cysteine-rich domain containing protein [Quillaja saponaria]
MAQSLGFSPVCSLKTSNKPGIAIGNSVSGKVFRINEAFLNSKAQKFQTLEVKATNNNQSTKPKSIVCSDCDGNGAVSCSQCKGTGVNSVDHFNGQFKAGGLCWLCRGKRDILCGNCNGAGFVGGFMSTFDA